MAIECESRLGTMEERLESVWKELKEYQDHAWSSSFGGDKEIAKIVDVMNEQYDSISELESAARKLEGDLIIVGREFTGTSA